MSTAPPEEAGVEALRGRFEALGEDLPRIVLFLFEARDGELLDATLDRIPRTAAECRGASCGEESR